AVHLVDHAVDVEGQVFPLLADGAVVLDQAFRAVGDFVGGIDRQAELLDGGQELALGRERDALELAEAVGREAQRPPRGDFRIELAHRARGGVARVDVRALARGAQLLVHALEIRAPHEDLTSDFQDRGRRLRVQPARDAPDGPDVLGYVLAGLAVASGRRLRELPILIAQADGKAVELQLDRVLDWRRI